MEIVQSCLAQWKEDGNLSREKEPKATETERPHKSLRFFTSDGPHAVGNIRRCHVDVLMASVLSNALLAKGAETTDEYKKYSTCFVLCATEWSTSISDRSEML